MAERYLPEDSRDCNELLRNSLENLTTYEVIRREMLNQRLEPDLESSLNASRTALYNSVIDFHDNLDPTIRHLVCSAVKILNTCSHRELTPHNQNISLGTFENVENYPGSFSYGSVMLMSYFELSTFFGVQSTYDIPSQRFIAGLFARIAINLFTGWMHSGEYEHYGYASRGIDRPYMFPNMTDEHRTQLKNLFQEENLGGIFQIFNHTDWYDIYELISFYYSSYQLGTYDSMFTHIKNNCIFNGSLGYMLDSMVGDTPGMRITNFLNSFKEYVCSRNPSRHSTTNFCPVQLVCRAVPQAPAPAQSRAKARGAGKRK